jgi:hypothetical protein
LGGKLANYITKEILSEAYTHLDIELFEDKVKLEKLKQELTKFYQDRASFLFGSKVEIEVLFEEGSLKTRILAIGSAAALIAGGVLANYGTFRESVIQLSSDAVSLAQAANLEVIFRTKTPYCDRIRVEKRKGVFGRVSTRLAELDAIKNVIDSSRLPTNNNKLHEANTAVDSLLTWDSNLDVLFTKFDGPETEACVAEGLIEEIKKLPRQLPWHADLGKSSFRAELATNDPTFSGNVAAVATRYATSLKTIEKKLKDRMTQSIAKLRR